MDASGSPESSSAETLVYRLESAEGGKLRGWIVDSADLDRPVEFDLVVGGQVLARIQADAERSDVARRFGSAGRHGFSITIQPGWSSDRPRSLRFQLADGRRVGPNKRLLIQAAPDAAEAAPATQADRDLQRLLSALKRLQGGKLSMAAEVRDLLERAVVRPAARRAFAEQRWGDLAKLRDLVQPSGGAGAANQLLVARGLIYAGKAADARALLLSAAERQADNPEWCFYLGLACSRADRPAEALPWLERAVAAKPEATQYLRELALVTARAARGGEQRLEIKTALRERAVRLFDQAAETNEAAAAGMLLGAAQALVDLGRPADALARIEAALAREPSSRQGLLVQSRALIAAGNLAGALDASRRLLEIEPGNQAAQYQARTLARLIDVDVTGRADRTVLTLAPAALAGAWPLLAPLLAGDVAPGDWVAVTARPLDGGDLDALLAQAPRWCGRLIVGSGEDALVFWRLELLLGFERSGLLGPDMDLAAALDGLAWSVATVRTGPGSSPLPERPAGGTVVCMSRHGTRMFGGGEHFLASMADHYERAGFDPVIVGAQSRQAEEAGTTPEGRRWAFADADVDALRRFLLAQRPAAVHVLSGLGFEVAHALQYLDIPFVYGVHFWRDCLGAAEGTDRYFEDFDRKPIPRRLFQLVIERAAAIYSNSDYTRAVLEEAFHVRTPVIYSLPPEDWPEDDRDAALALTGGIEDYVLLLNARTDKGFGLLLDVAERLPDVPFVAVASQSDRAPALHLVAERGLRNVHVIARTDRPDLLYRHALAAAVPSYQFVETFSRVCIEAHRFGCPVIGSDRGNVPYLLREAGTVLPEKADLWAAEIARLAGDGAYRAARQRLARENSARYAYRRQEDAVGRLIPKLRRRILVAIGSGLGNMLHVGPAIRAIARHFGQPVDIVVAEDHADSLFLLHDPAVVSEVLALGAAVLGRAYDIVFVTSSFGEMRPPFAGRQVLYARDWQRFEAAGPLHETIHNLEAARVLLGVPWTEADGDNAYIGELSYRPPAGGRLVGFHGGSKEGFWASKRWPGYAALARRLAAHGWECASFGTPGEYVEGTIDRTGGSIAEMADAMRDCSYFVTNDSGVMNIANALGIPLTALFAPTNPATRAPLRSTSTFIQVAKSCSPCEVTLEGRETFYGGLCRCIAEIGVDGVEAHVLAHMTTLGLAPAG